MFGVEEAYGEVYPRCPECSIVHQFPMHLMTGENDSDEILTQALPAVEGCKNSCETFGTFIGI